MLLEDQANLAMQAEERGEQLLHFLASRYFPNPKLFTREMFTTFQEDFIKAFDEDKLPSPDSDPQRYYDSSWSHVFENRLLKDWGATNYKCYPHRHPHALIRELDYDTFVKFASGIALDKKLGTRSVVIQRDDPTVNVRPPPEEPDPEKLDEFEKHLLAARKDEKFQAEVLAARQVRQRRTAHTLDLGEMNDYLGNKVGEKLIDFRKQDAEKGGESIMEEFDVTPDSLRSDDVDAEL